MIDRNRIRHIFVPAIEFLVNVTPQGEGKPTYIEKAAVFLIEGRDRDGTPMSVDEFIFQMGLGEPRRARTCQRDVAQGVANHPGQRGHLAPVAAYEGRAGEEWGSC